MDKLGNVTFGSDTVACLTSASEIKKLRLLIMILMRRLTVNSGPLNGSGRRMNRRCQTMLPIIRFQKRQRMVLPQKLKIGLMKACWWKLTTMLALLFI